MFWKKFVNLCAKNGKSTTAVVLELGISRSSITNWKRGVIPNNVSLNKIANYFNVSTEYLIEDDEKILINGTTITGHNHVFGNINPTINNGKNTLNGIQLSLQEQELISYFRELSEIEKARVLIYISEFKEDVQK